MSKVKNIDLTNNNHKLSQQKKEYTLDDKILTSIQLEKNVKVCLIENEKGCFVDIRKYYNEFPTKKGIRIEVHTFKDVIKSLEEDLNHIKF